MNPILSRPAKIRGLAFLGLLLMALAILGGMIWRNLHHFDTVLSYVDYSHRIQNVAVDLQQSLIVYLTEKNPHVQPVTLAKTLDEMDALMTDNSQLSDSTKSNLANVRAMLTNVLKLDKQEKNAHLIKSLQIMTETLDYEAMHHKYLHNFN